MHISGRRFLWLVPILVFAMLVSAPFPRVKAFSEKELAFINIGVPVVMAALRAHYNGSSIKKAVLQAAFGGYMMQQSFKLAPGIEDKSALHAWQAKLMLNLGSSLAESAGDKFVFRMDIGPVWLIADQKKIRFKLGLNGVVAPIVHLCEGSKIDWGRSFRYGTMAFKRDSNTDGTLNNSGALAYSTANTFTTNSAGQHSGHEIVHTFQYRRDAMSPLRIGNLVSGFDKKIGDGWVDDTAWSINWGLQCAWADANGKSKDFDIPMEEEAYYLEESCHKNF
ncbi:MAG: hypothetical protein PHV05_04135 [Candidatus Riflebacteria bacterium]|nr:hypothetical protein [Candidatus Riflebacteria bacterium]